MEPSTPFNGEEFLAGAVTAAKNKCEVVIREQFGDNTTIEFDDERCRLVFPHMHGDPNEGYTLVTIFASAEFELNKEILLEIAATCNVTCTNRVWTEVEGTATVRTIKSGESVDTSFLIIPA